MKVEVNIHPQIIKGIEKCKEYNFSMEEIINTGAGNYISEILDWKQRIKDQRKQK